MWILQDNNPLYSVMNLNEVFIFIFIQVHVKQKDSIFIQNLIEMGPHSIISLRSGAVEKVPGVLLGTPYHIERSFASLIRHSGSHWHPAWGLDPSVPHPLYHSLTSNCGVFLLSPTFIPPAVDAINHVPMWKRCSDVLIYCKSTAQLKVTSFFSLPDSPSNCPAPIRIN